MEDTSHKNFVDREWIELMEEAKSIGLTVQEVKLFLTETSKSKTN